MSWSDSASFALTEFLKEIRYNDKVLDRMKRAQIFSLPETYVDTGMTQQDERKIDNIERNDADAFLRQIGGLDLKMWHRWFFVEHFEVLHSVGSVETSLLHHEHVKENQLLEPCNLKMHEARTISKTILRDTLEKWCTTRLGNDVFMHYFTTTSVTERHDSLENKSSKEPPPGLPQIHRDLNFHGKTRHQRRGAFCLVRSVRARSARI
jgi:hypothetical protein